MSRDSIVLLKRVYDLYVQNIFFIQIKTSFLKQWKKLGKYPAIRPDSTCQIYGRITGYEKSQKAGYPVFGYPARSLSGDSLVMSLDIDIEGLLIFEFKNINAL